MCKAQEIVRYRVLRFHSFEAAQSVALSAPKLVVVRGDCPEYWVVTPREASILVAAGYEYP